MSLQNLLGLGAKILIFFLHSIYNAIKLQTPPPHKTPYRNRYTPSSLLLLWGINHIDGEIERIFEEGRVS